MTTEPTTDQGRWLLDHQGLVNISEPAHHSMRGDEIDLRASVLAIEAEAVATERERITREVEAEYAAAAAQMGAEEGETTLLSCAAVLARINPEETS